MASTNRRKPAGVREALLRAKGERSWRQFADDINAEHARRRSGQEISHQGAWLWQRTEVGARHVLAVAAVSADKRIGPADLCPSVFAERNLSFRRLRGETR